MKRDCVEHGGSALCIECKFARHNPKYDKYCIDCFVNYYPDDPRSDRNSQLMRRETVVRQAIDGVFKDFIHDKAYFTGGCCEHRRRIDHRIAASTETGSSSFPRAATTGSIQSASTSSAPSLPMRGRCLKSRAKQARPASSSTTMAHSAILGPSAPCTRASTNYVWWRSWLARRHSASHAS